MFNRVDNQRYICSVKLYFSGHFELLNLSGEAPINDRLFKTFHNKFDVGVSPYYTKGTFKFVEESSEVEAGIVYRQQAVWRFPSNDIYRSARFNRIHSVKFLGIILNDGTEFIMGRNDIIQNARPNVSMSSDMHMTEVKVTTESITPVLQIFKPEDGSDIIYGYDYTYDFELS